MGSDYKQSPESIERIRKHIEALPECREYLAHHLRNNLSPILAEGQSIGNNIIVECADHAIKDLTRVGC